MFPRQSGSRRRRRRKRWRRRWRHTHPHSRQSVWEQTNMRDWRERNGMERNGMEWNGMKCGGGRCQTMPRLRLVSSCARAGLDTHTHTQRTEHSRAPTVRWPWEQILLPPSLPGASPLPCVRNRKELLQLHRFNRAESLIHEPKVE